MTRLIADSGSTKTHWCLVTNHNEDFYFETEGFNPFYVNRQYIITAIYKDFPTAALTGTIQEIFFYGAGCTSQKLSVLGDALSVIFKSAKITVNSDLLAAAKGLLKNNAGFAAILGTGTNSCIYDGERIVAHIDSLGFLLGDEGSGAAIGKQVCSDYIRGKMNVACSQLFKSVYQISPDDLLQKIYAHALPNRYCATYCKFLSHTEIEPNYVNQLVKNAFENFFNNIVSSYKGFQSYTFNCCGSVAFNFKEILQEVITSYGMVPGIIEPSIINRLVDYHKGPLNA